MKQRGEKAMRGAFLLKIQIIALKQSFKGYNNGIARPRGPKRGTGNAWRRKRYGQGFKNIHIDGNGMPDDVVLIVQPQETA